MAGSRAGRWPISAVTPWPLRASAMDWLLFPAQRAAVASVRAGNGEHGTGSAPVCPSVTGGNGGRVTQFLWRLKIDAIKIRLLLTARRCLTARFAARYFVIVATSPAPSASPQSRPARPSISTMPFRTLPAHIQLFRLHGRYRSGVSLYAPCAFRTGRAGGNNEGIESIRCLPFPPPPAVRFCRVLGLRPARRAA